MAAINDRGALSTITYNNGLGYVRKDGIFVTQARGKVVANDANSATIFYGDNFLQDYGDDFFKDRYNAWNITQNKLVRITGYVSATAKFTTDTITTDYAASDDIIVILETIMPVGGVDSLSAILEDTGTTLPSTLSNYHTTVAADGTDNDVIADVIGNKEDGANDTADEASLVGLNREELAQIAVIDANVDTILTRGPRITTNTTPDAGVGTWTPASHKLFTVTGVVKLRVFGVVTDALVEGNGDETIEVGIANNTALILAQYATPLDFISGDVWGSTTAVPGSTLNDMVVVSNTDVDLTVAGSIGITDGSIDFYCEWTPVSTGATVTAGVWD